MKGMDTDNEKVVEVITDEPSRVHRIALPPGLTSGEKIWKWALLVVSTLAAAMVIAGGLGRAFYVTRSEYVEDARIEAVARENMRGTLERLDRTLTEQAAAFRELTGEVQTIKIDVVRVGTKKR